MDGAETVPVRREKKKRSKKAAKKRRSRKLEEAEAAMGEGMAAARGRERALESGEVGRRTSPRRADTPMGMGGVMGGRKAILPPGSEQNRRKTAEELEQEAADDEDGEEDAPAMPSKGTLLKAAVVSKVTGKSALSSAKNEFVVWSSEEDEDDSELEVSDEEEEDDVIGGIRLRISTRQMKNYQVLGYMLTIRTSIMIFRVVPRFYAADLPVEEYRRIMTYYILPVGAPNELEVSDYAGKVFELIRRKQNINCEEFLASWCDADIGAVMASTGKSESSFVFSSDKKYIIKTLTRLEAKSLLTILPEYVRHLLDNPDTLLVKYLGLFRVTEGKKSTFFTVYSNVFDPEHGPSLDRYDLKGSRVARSAKGREVTESPVADVKLDKDLTRTFHIGNKRKKQFIEQIQRDVAFLTRKKLMDYSLLVGVCDRSADKQERKNKHGLSEFIETKKVPAMVYFVQTGAEDEEPDTTFEPRAGAEAPLRSSMKRTKRKHVSEARVAALKEADPDGYASDYNTVIRSGMRELSQGLPDLPSLDSMGNGDDLSNFSFTHQDDAEVILSHRGTRQAPTVAVKNGAIQEQEAHEGKFSTMKSSKYHDAKELYTFGIIDILQKYNRKKKLANFAKSMKHDRDQISTVEPKLYGKRFTDYITAITE
eukprot:CAMPEP_0114617668 /NCGR_PEP_ID=MMETSP0168-20121206/7313_1 /TAXON_ID=95228 ORGANISM="Vannella sp., Strain DIVA3 517/6/12" /NCGR_SAMPLE_ID=MMETSP0168 /ASSEMBLY_ACC=CAM_ASM_000044 /LENGTH=650 /DNA_ID=CAMNT_0001828805 /DNA_START=202 /DNA_END=2154 /DNA_ORIENTATION=-